MSLLDSLPHVCSIQKTTRTKSALGGNKDVPTVEQTGIECWQQQASASEINDYQKRGIQVTCKIYFTSDPGVTEQHEIVITERNGITVSGAGEIYEVMSETIPDAGAGLGVLFKVMGRNIPSRDQ